MGLALLMLCSPLVTACGEKQYAVEVVKPPVERLICEAAGARPAIPPEAPATAPREDYTASVRAREGVISGYILDLESRLFKCSDNAQWLRDFYAKLPSATPR